MRRTRLVLPNVPLHIIQRGNNRQRCFCIDDDYLAYVRWLHEFARASACRIHSYVLMTNHVHLLASAPQAAALATMMKGVAQSYTQYFNRHYQRSGTLWDGRYKSCLILDERYFLTCQRYMELNPVRAGLVRFPGNYRWSSYRGNAEGRRNDVLTPHELYLRLGVTPAARQRAYRELFNEVLAAHDIERIRAAASSGRALGDERSPPRQPE